MTESPLAFDPRWNHRDLCERYEALPPGLKACTSAAAMFESFDEWEKIRRDVASWKIVTEIRTRQSVADAEASENAGALAVAAPLFETHETEIKRFLLASPQRQALEARIGSTAFSRWAIDVESSDPTMQPHLEEQLRLSDRYTALMGSLRFRLDGNEMTYSGLAGLQKHPDRELRRRALAAQWTPFQEHGEEFDDIFDGLVRSRTAMALCVGESNFTALAYRRLGRNDYGIAEVRTLRKHIHCTIVPLVADLMRAQAGALGIERLMPWDESTYDAASRIPLNVPMEQIAAGLQRGYDALDDALAAFARTMAQSGLIDGQDRPGKAPGTFSEFLPHAAMPFVFANATGVPNDALTLAHETGHAFQAYCSRNYVPLEYITPTNEAAEIHSTALEFLLWPYYDAIAGEAADEFRRAHLRRLISMLPYVAAIDEFQEVVYGNPSATAQERHATWRELERFYLPWRTNGEIPALRSGRAWQAQRHVYRFPFYYIDYAIATFCALQLWSESHTSPREAANRYVRLCSLGGTLPFTQLLRKVELRSPFELQTINEVMHEVASYLR